MTKALEKTKTLPATQEGQAATMLRVAQESGASVEIIDKIAELYREEREDVRRAAFNAAMTAAQSEMRMIGVDGYNKHTDSKYASYAALDRAVRPIYTAHGFGLSFDTADGAAEGMARVICHVSHVDGYSRDYRIDMPADGKGPKGGDVMTKTHATGAAMSYGMRYLLKMIFNVAVGEDDNDGNAPPADPINQAQAATIAGLCKQLPPGMEDKMLNVYGVSAIAELPASVFGEAVKTLNKRIDKFLAAEKAAEK